MHVLESMKTREAPVRKLKYQEMFTRLWEEGGCIRENVLKVLDGIDNCPQVE